MYNPASNGRNQAGRLEVESLETGVKKALRVVFMGSDEFSVPSLERCLAEAEVVAAYTQPDRPSGRGRRTVTATPVKELAQASGLHVERPERFDKSCCERLAGFEPDLLVVAAYGHVLPRAALHVARLDSVNVHASLLPRHRGAAPVAAAILAGDSDAGVTIMRLRPRLDAGEVLCIGPGRTPAQRAVRIGETETAGELTARLAKLGGELLGDVFRAFADGSVTVEAQNEALATLAPALTKADGRIDWSRDAAGVIRHVRAMTPWPGAFAVLHAPGRPAMPLIVLEAGAAGPEAGGPPGAIRVERGVRVLVAAGSGSVELRRVKPAGRTAMNAAEFLRGCPALRDGRPGGCFLAGA